MKVTIPDALKADVPDTTWGKMLSAMPVVMTVIATMLAGLASSEMTRAQYERAFAAQMQAKAADQWGFFQAKRLRGSMQGSTLEILSATHASAPFSRSTLDPILAGATLDRHPGSEWTSSETGQRVLDALEKGTIPPGLWNDRMPAGLERAFRAHESGADESIAAAVQGLDEASINQGLQDMRDRIRVLDELTGALNRGIAEVERVVDGSSVATPELKMSVNLSRIRFSIARYEAEARLNQSVATIYELKVRKANDSAQRHHIRSVRFFYGMLAAQLAVIVATLAMAAKERSWLWGISAAAGLIALAIAIYVYLYV